MYGFSEDFYIILELMESIDLYVSLELVAPSYIDDYFLVNTFGTIQTSWINVRDGPRVKL